MNWQIWAVQGAVLTCAAAVCAFASAMRWAYEEPNQGVLISAVIAFVLAIGSFIVAGWVAPWGAS